jgi:hypothetical protein
VSADLPVTTAEKGRAVRVQAVFYVGDERQAQMVTAKMIDRANQIANLPECECDVDVSVEMAPLERSPGSAGADGAPLHGHPPKS